MPDPRTLRLPACFDRCLLPECTPDGRYVYSTDALECLLVARQGMLPERAHAFIRRCTQDTRPWGPDYLD